MKTFYPQPQLWCHNLNLNANLLAGSDQVGGAANEGFTQSESTYTDWAN